MGSPVPPGVPSWRLAPEPENVAAARSFVRSALDGADPDLVETAALLAGELVTNVVLHARTEAEVWAWTVDGQAHVRVADRRPDRGLVPRGRHPYATTGRGLALVEELSAGHGVHSGPERKTVWFELWPGAPVPPLSPWETVAPSVARVGVTLSDVPYALYGAAQQHGEGLLREVHLAAADPGGKPGTGVPPRDLVVAQDASHLVSACMTAAVERETPDSATLSLRVAFPADAAPAVATLRRVLDEADALAQQGSLLTLPALPQIRAFRHWLLDQITGQLSGGPATAWTLAPGLPGAVSRDLGPWDPAEAEAAHVPTVAADDRNRIIAVNEAAASLVGWQPHELVGQRLTVLMPEHLRHRHLTAFTSLLLTGEPRILGRSVPVPALHRDGRQIPVRLAVQTQEAVDGRTVFVAQLSATTAPPAPSGVPSDDRPATRPVPPTPHGQTTPRRTRGLRAGTAAPEWLELFADTGQALAGTLDVDEGLRRTCHVLTRGLADWCTADLLDEQGRLVRVCIVHRDDRVPIAEEHFGRFPPLTADARGPLPRVLRGAGPLLLTDSPPLGRGHSRVDARQRALVDRLGGSSAVVAPLRAQGRIFGALTLVRVRDEHPFTRRDVPLIAELVRGIALGVDNARLHQSVHSSAEQLQRALLPTLPRHEHLELAARYLPSSATAEVGGDWYDVFVLPGGETVLVVGDVAGHDLKAAVAMSALRNMLRGIAVDRQEPPGDVLRRLDLASHTLDQRSTATCVYGVVKQDGGATQWHYSSAGHLPPLLITPSGGARYLDGGRGVLIGMDPDLPRASARESLPPGSTLLLFTDGLIERRGESLGDAMTRLGRHAAAHAGDPLEVFCDELVIAFGADTTDDVALLALRPTPPDPPA
ncbi:SpoIIE family protein phosphatase [Streptomyces longwoodensis]|uniref:SpoIIE family protein phosphatase n=1 Tax=Streptomyces longwoodensis TaxID=68231 RepID=UPI002E824577|nr:SpoIIE family protein phosphatase [Streptomyces longwoodensis]WUC59862.1 SpoIIE family protein phosphatase [Streptomyces longwoodensis]